jgi:predicted RNA-binding Zn-ribbon protein involved in translation (DUF1610 family)
MRIIENPNPVPTFVFTCPKCSCKFECTENEIKHKSCSDANGRLGGTHHWSTTTYINCPNCGEKIIISRQSGYGSSVIDDQHITENYHIAQGNPDDPQIPEEIKNIINAK